MSSLHLPTANDVLESSPALPRWLPQQYSLGVYSNGCSNLRSGLCHLKVTSTGGSNLGSDLCSTLLVLTLLCSDALVVKVSQYGLLTQWNRNNTTVNLAESSVHNNSVSKQRVSQYDSTQRVNKYNNTTINKAISSLQIIDSYSLL